MARGSNKAVAAKLKPQPKKTSKTPGKRAENLESEHAVSKELQQKCLNIFRDTLKPGEGDAKMLQEVKGHLFNRDFARAFGDEDYLRVYASRWSPSRALGYLQILTDVQDELLQHRRDAGPANETPPYKVASIGGGAGAEVVALAGWTHALAHDQEEAQLPTLHATYLDVAGWGDVVASLHQAATTAPEISKYASSAAKEANVALVQGEAFTATFHQRDALELDEECSHQIFGAVDLVTLMFTLNELYSTSMPKTQRLLAEITAAVRPGCYLLVVDSPGSYSTVAINGAEKKYPMQWLLDHTLLGSAVARNTEDAAPARWQKVISDESRWFRLPQGLQYPIELENMRYQIHLYRRLVDV